jgi:HEPN domain-containing protein
MRKEVENLWKQAEKDLEVAEKNFKLKEYYVTAFFCQQSVEKALKTLFIKKEQRLIKTHGISNLAKELKLPDKLISNISELEPIYQESRYPDITEEVPYEKYEEKDATDFINIAEEVLEWIKSRI